MTTFKLWLDNGTRPARSHTQLVNHTPSPHEKNFLHHLVPLPVSSQMLNSKSSNVMLHQIVFYLLEQNDRLPSTWTGFHRFRISWLSTMLSIQPSKYRSVLFIWKAKEYLIRHVNYMKMASCISLFHKHPLSWPRSLWKSYVMDERKEQSPRSRPTNDVNETCFKTLSWNSCKNDKNSKTSLHLKVIRKEFKCFTRAKNIPRVAKDTRLAIVFFSNSTSVCTKPREFANKDIV